MSSVNDHTQFKWRESIYVAYSNGIVAKFKVHSVTSEYITIESDSGHRYNVDVINGVIGGERGHHFGFTEAEALESLAKVCLDEAKRMCEVADVAVKRAEAVMAKAMKAAAESR